MDSKTTFYLFATVCGAVGIGLYITNAVFTFEYKKYDFNNDSIISQIQKGLQSQFIYDFNAKAKCADNEERLNLGIWYGTYDKCNCIGKVLNRICIFDNETSCYTTRGQKSRYFTKFNGKEICVKRSGDTYMDLLNSGKIIPKSENCPSTDKSCGIVDTLDRKLCVKKADKCPINSNNIKKKVSFTLSQYTSNQFLDNNGIYFLDEANAEEKVISEIKLSDGFPCINYSEFHWVAYHPDEIVKFHNCSELYGRTTDDRYDKFTNFQITKQKLYIDNELSDFVTEELKKDKSPINLYGTTLLGVNLGESGFNYDKLISVQNLANKCNHYMLISTIISFCILVFPAIGTYRACNRKGPETECCLVVFFSIGGVTICLTFLADFVLCIIIFIAGQKINGLLMENLGISDEITNEMIRGILKKFSSNYSFAIAIIVVLIAFTGLAIITAYLYRKKNWI